MEAGLRVAVYAALSVGLLFLLFSLAFIRRPLRSLLSGGIQGICALMAVNVAGIFTGVSLGINLYSSLVCLFLGVPGVVSMLILHFLTQAI